MNIDALRGVQDKLREEGIVDMAYWLRKPTKDEPECGTVGCICGWALVNAGFAQQDSCTLDPEHPLFQELGWPTDEATGHYGNPAWDMVQPSLTLGTAGFDPGRKLLDLTTDQAMRLFYTANWPSQWKIRYDEATTACDRAKVVYDYIDWFIAQEEGRHAGG